MDVASVQVILGGGRRAFLPKGQDKGRREDGRDLVQAWKDGKKGSTATYVTTKTELDAVNVDKTDYLLGTAMTSLTHKTRPFLQKSLPVEILFPQPIAYHDKIIKSLSKKLMKMLKHYSIL